MKCLIRSLPRALFAIVPALLLATGCQTTTEPVTGRSQFILTAPGEEMRLGLQAWQDILAEEKPTPNQEYAAAVERVGAALVAQVGPDMFDWEFRTFASEQANAFCLPGGKIGVYDGLFKYVDNDAELAAVIGHEIAHAVARHGGERMTQVMLQNLGALGLSAALGSKAEEDRARWMAAYAGVTTVGVILPYSRTHEYAADEIGTMYMARSGYDPRAALSFWEKFAGDSAAPGIFEFLSTHPVGQNRINRLRQIIPRALLEYEAAPVQRGYGTTYR